MLAHISISKSEKISLRLVYITSTTYWCMEMWWIAWQCNPHNPHNPCNPCKISQGLHGISWYGMVLFMFACPYNIVWIMSEHCHDCLSMQSGGILLHFCWWGTHHHPVMMLPWSLIVCKDGNSGGLRLSPTNLESDGSTSVESKRK